MENNNTFDMDPHWESDNISAPKEEIKAIRKSILKRNWKLIITSLVLTATVLLCTVYGIVPLVERLYWHPGTSEFISNSTDLTATLQAYTELFSPGWEVRSVHWSPKEGLAAYDLSVSIWDINHQEHRYLSGTLEKNKLSLDRAFTDEHVSINLFGRATYPFYSMEDTQIQNTRQKLEQLPEYILLEAAITFPQDMSMEEVIAFYEKHQPSVSDQPLEITWVAIRNSPINEQRTPLCGMDPFSGGIGYETDEERYPSFSYIYYDPQGQSLEQHFKSILRYSSDQLENGRGFPVWINKNYYSTVLEYVEENGVYSYGCTVLASPKTLLALLDSKEASQVYIMDGWLDIGS